MRSFIRWRDEWLLDIEDVDREHRGLVSLLNRLAVAHCCSSMPAGDPNRQPPRGDQVIEMLEALGEGVRRHFHNEEAVMRASGYPDYESHSYEHVTLLAEYAELMREIRQQGTQCLDLATLESLKEWLIGHIVGADQKFGRFYHEAAGDVPQRKPDAFARRWMRWSLRDQ